MLGHGFWGRGCQTHGTYSTSCCLSSPPSLLQAPWGVLCSPPIWWWVLWQWLRAKGRKISKILQSSWICWEWGGGISAYGGYKKKKHHGGGSGLWVEPLFLIFSFLIFWDWVPSCGTHLVLLRISMHDHGACLSRAKNSSSYYPLLELAEGFQMKSSCIF